MNGLLWLFHFLQPAHSGDPLGDVPPLTTPLPYTHKRTHTSVTLASVFYEGIWGSSTWAHHAFRHSVFMSWKLHDIYTYIFLSVNRVISPNDHVTLCSVFDMCLYRAIIVYCEGDLSYNVQFEGYTPTRKTINILTLRLLSELMGREIIIWFSMVSTQSLWLYTDVFPQLMILHTSMKSKHAFVKNTSEHTGTGNVKMKYWLQTARPNSALIKMCYFCYKTSLWFFIMYVIFTYLWYATIKNTHLITTFLSL